MTFRASEIFEATARQQAFMAIADAAIALKVDRLVSNWLRLSRQSMDEPVTRQEWKRWWADEDFQTWWTDGIPEQGGYTDADLGMAKHVWLATMIRDMTAGKPGVHSAFVAHERAKQAAESENGGGDDALDDELREFFKRGVKAAVRWSAPKGPDGEPPEAR